MLDQVRDDESPVSTAGGRAAFGKRPGDHFERFGQRDADATERSLRTAVAKISKLKWRVVRPRRRREIMKNLLKIFAIGSSILLLTACNTVDGAGKDVESAADCADGVKGNC
jgi:entericidin A